MVDTVTRLRLNHYGSTTELPFVHSSVSPLSPQTAPLNLLPSCNPPRRYSLVVLAALLLATRAERLPEECMGRVCAVLASEDLRGSDHPGVRRQLHSSVANLVRAAGPRVAPFAKNLFLVLLQVSVLYNPQLLLQNAPLVLSCVCNGKS